MEPVLSEGMETMGRPWGTQGGLGKKKILAFLASGLLKPQENETTTPRQKIWKIVQKNLLTGNGHFENLAAHTVTKPNWKDT